MLIYDPSLDPYHCSVRVVAILEFCGVETLDFEAVRIADFFLAYPAALVSFRFVSTDQHIRKHAKQLSSAGPDQAAPLPAPVPQ